MASTLSPPSKKVRMPRAATFLGLACTLLANGCTLAPTYHRPALPVPETYPLAQASATESQAADVDWRDFYADPKLRQVIELALANNRDLRVAILNIESARATYRVQRSSLFPSISASSSDTVQRTSPAMSQTGRAIETREYSASVGFTSYELDVFGRVRSLSEQALQSFYATEAARHSTQISLVAEVASAWLTLAADRERLVLAEETFKSRSENLELMQRSFDLGNDSQLSLSQTHSEVDSARADVANYRSQVAEDRDELVLLAGTSIPDDLLPERLSDSLNALSELPAGIPSQLLERRPDILEAEADLKAANANIGAARAAFFPAISLTASAGSSSPSLDELFKSGSGAWSFTPSISLPLFDAGKNLANLKSAKITRDIKVAGYEKAIQSAFHDVADALAARSQLGEQLDAQTSQVKWTAQSLDLSQARFAHGIDSHLNVLDSRRSLYSAQQSLITTRLARLNNSVTLYKALGGGWSYTPSGNSN